MWDFSNDQAPKQNDFKPIPAGTYIVQVETAETKETKAKTGKYFNLRFKVTGGEHKGRVLFHRFNVENKSEKAQEIGRREVKALMVAAGRTSFQLSGPSDLVGLGCAVKVSVDTEGDRQSNTIRAFIPMNTASMAVSETSGF